MQPQRALAGVKVGEVERPGSSAGEQQHGERQRTRQLRLAPRPLGEQPFHRQQQRQCPHVVAQVGERLGQRPHRLYRQHRREQRKQRAHQHHPAGRGHRQIAAGNVPRHLQSRGILRSPRTGRAAVRAAGRFGGHWDAAAATDQNQGQHPGEPQEHRPGNPVGGEQLAGIDRETQQDRGRPPLIFPEADHARVREKPAALPADHSHPGEIRRAERHHHGPGGGQRQPLPGRRRAGAEQQMPGGKRQHGRRAAGVVVEERQHGNQRQRAEMAGLPAAPPALVQVERGDHRKRHERVVTGLAKVQQHLRRPVRQQQAEEDQARMLRQMLPQEQVKEHQRQDSNQCRHDACAGLVDPEHGHSHGIEDVGQRRQHVAQILVQRAPIGAAHQVAPVPAGDVAPLQQVAAEQRGRRLVVPQRGVVEIHQTQIGRDRQRRHRERGIRCGAHPLHQANAQRRPANAHGSCPAAAKDTSLRSNTPTPW